MYKSKLVLALRSLDSEEWKSLKKFALLEHTIKSDHYQLLEKLNKSLTSGIILVDSESFRATFFTEMSIKSFLNLSSRVFITFEEWLAWYEFKKNKEARDVLLVKTYNRRGLFSLADKKFSKINNVLTEKRTLNLKTNKNLADLYYYHHFSENEVKVTQGGGLLQNAVNSALQSIHEIFNIYLLEMKNYGEVVKFDYSEEIRLLEKFVDLLPSSDTSLLINKMHEVFDRRDSGLLYEIYQELCDNRVDSGSDLEVLLTLYGALFSSHLFNEGELKEPKLVFDFYNYALKNGIYNKLGKITCLKFLNMVAVIIHSQSTNDSELFVKNWIHKIEDENVESALNLCLAFVRLKEKKYGEIVFLLRAQKYKYYYTQFIALAMELTAFYKIKEWEVLDFKMKNFKRRLGASKGKVAQSTYFRFINYIDLINQLAKFNFNPKIKVSLSHLDNVFNKSWLIEELKSKGF